MKAATTFSGMTADTSWCTLKHFCSFLVNFTVENTQNVNYCNQTLLDVECNSHTSFNQSPAKEEILVKNCFWQLHKTMCNSLKQILQNRPLNNHTQIIHINTTQLNAPFTHSRIYILNIVIHFTSFRRVNDGMRL